MVLQGVEVVSLRLEPVDGSVRDSTRDVDPSIVVKILRVVVDDAVLLSLSSSVEDSTS